MHKNLFHIMVHLCIFLIYIYFYDLYIIFIM